MRVLLPIAAVVALLMLAFPASEAARGASLSTCFWEGPISTQQPSTRGFDGRNFNFPEESATYWLARFNLPSGSRLRLKGRYAHGRYQSVNSYSDGAPTDALSDFQTAPDPGSTNPFIAGHRRDLTRRSYTVTVLNAPVPASSRARNTLYAQPQTGKPIELLYRVYEPDRGRDLAGGTGLPAAELVQSNGTVLRGTAACRAVNDPDRSIPVQTIPAAEWQAAVRTPGCDPETNPAYNPVRWERFFNLDYASLAVISDCTAQGRAARRNMSAEARGGLYSNRDNAYIYAHLSRRFAPLLVLRAKLPTFPATFDGQRTMGRGQLRFWSLCTGESRVTTLTPDCVADRQVPTDRGRGYTVVVSRAADRPSNARRECGVAWVDWGLRGDAAGRPDYGLLIMRNMLPASFAEAIQRVQRPGAEPSVMREFFPRSTYSTKPGFEAQGCPASRLAIRSRGLRARRNRRVRIRMAFNSPAPACTGRVRIATRRRYGRRQKRQTLGRRAFRVAGGGSRRVTVRVNRRGRRILRRHGKKKVIVLARCRTSWDSVITARRKYRLKGRRVHSVQRPHI